jgi:hypothetical protein
MIHWDTSDVDRLAADLSRAPGRIRRAAPGVFRKGALETKRNLKRMASGHSHLSGAQPLDAAVAYDELSPLHYEIGFDKGGTGSLANIAVYGSANNAPIMGTPADALRMELPSIMRHLGDEGADAVFGGRE